MQRLFIKPIANIEASRQLARELYQDYLLPAGNFTVFLEGGLGAGKTFLVRELLGQFGVIDEITSPTYALVNEYQGVGRFAHFDFYRLSDLNDFFARGFADLAEDPSTSCFVEWPDKISPLAKSAFSGKCYTLKVEFGLGVGMRKVTLLVN